MGPDCPAESTLPNLVERVYPFRRGSRLSFPVYGENGRAAHRPILRATLVAVSLALPAILIFSAIRSFRSVNQMREVYLRNGAAKVAL